MGIIYYKGIKVKKNLSVAMSYFKKASLYGDIKAKYNIATIYSLKQYKYHDYKKGYTLFLELAKLNHPKSQFRVANMLIHGQGTQKDYKEAMRWLEIAYFENKHKLSACSLAYLYANGLGTIQNLGRARKLSIDGYKNDIYLCKNVYEDFKLYKDKYKEDKGFKYGYYR
ncbi:MAG: tetratricopeptide repeat protein [Campylobacterota bacterium]|nr:tetratricopeptide repeat protein [Campylobacterota bacterium]